MHFAQYSNMKSSPKNVLGDKFILSRGKITGLVEYDKQFYILGLMNLQTFFMPPKELWEAYSNRTVRPSVCPVRFRVRSMFPIFFEVGIPNLVCGCILGWRSVAYHSRVTVTLTSDLVFRIIVSEAYLLYYLR